MTWEYLLMLLGQPGVKADRWITRFVAQDLGCTVSSNEAGMLLKSAARELEVSPTNLDYAIWRHMRRRRVPSRATD